MGSQTTQEVEVGASIEGVVQPKEGSEVMDQLSLLPVKACLSRAMASQALIPQLGFAEMVVMVELDQLLVRTQCSLHNLMKKTHHCWSQFLFWVHLLCLKFQREELCDSAAAVVVVGVGVSQGRVFGICLGLHLFL